MKKYIAILAISLIAILSSCGEKVEKGSLGEACFSDGTCEGELRCVSDTCVDMSEFGDNMVEFGDEDASTDEDAADNSQVEEDVDADSTSDETADDDIVSEKKCLGDQRINTLEELEEVKKCVEITGGLIFDETEFDEIELAELKKVLYIDVLDNYSLTALSVPVLESITGDLWIDFNTALTTLSFPELEKLGSLLIISNTELPSFDFSKLSQVADYFEISGNENLPTTDAEALKDQVINGDGIGGEVLICGNKDGADCIEE